MITLHPPEHDHALKEVDRAAMATAETPEQVSRSSGTRSRRTEGTRSSSVSSYR